MRECPACGTTQPFAELFTIERWGSSFAGTQCQRELELTAWSRFALVFWSILAVTLVARSAQSAGWGPILPPLAGVAAGILVALVVQGFARYQVKEPPASIRPDR